MKEGSAIFVPKGESCQKLLVREGSENGRIPRVSGSEQIFVLDLDMELCGINFHIHGDEDPDSPKAGFRVYEVGNPEIACVPFG